MLVSKWGNSLAVRLPKKLVDELGITSGDKLAIIAASKDEITVKKVDRRKEALERMKARHWTLPPDYRFDRDEAHER